MFKMNVNLSVLPDSMCMDSGELICTYKDGNDTIEIETRGRVDVNFRGERYRYYSDMPSELQELFDNGEAYDDDRVEISGNNWYEVFLNYDEEYDVAEIEGYTVEELENYCKDCMELFRVSRR